MMRINRHCAFFPCHDRLQDCTFCYCPFYPCRDERLGAFVRTKKGARIWSCQHCAWIHTKKTVDAVFDIIRASGFFNKKNGAQAPDMKKTAVVILGHGSKIEEANDTIREAVKEVRRKTGIEAVEPAYLQFSNPDLRQAIGRIADRGFKRVLIVPFFLFMGNHVKRDIPREIEGLKRLYKDMKFVYAKNIGQDRRIGEIVLDCIKEAL